MKKEDKGNTKGIILFLGIIILAVVLGIISNNFSGKVVSDINVNYEEGQPISGTLKFNLKEGELIPADSKVVFENSGEKYEYILSEILYDETTEGNFYAEGKSISGSGDGYGVEGKKEIYPSVNFELNILSSSENIEQESEIIESENEQLSAPEEVAESQESSEDLSKSSGEVSLKESVESQEQKNIIEKEKKSSENKGDSKEEKIEKEIEEETVSEESPITGESILKFLKIFPNLFLRMVGRVSMEIETTIDSEVSADNPFVYDLSEGQTAEIISSSQKVDLEISGNQAIVTTDYSEIENGFGEEYLGDEKKELIIDLSSLNLTLQRGELKTSLVYNNEEIVSISISLGNQISEESDLENDTEIIKDINNETTINITKINSTEEQVISLINLTAEEKEILINKFGNTSVELTDSKVVNNRLVVKYELNNYWVEYSYEYDGEIDDSLKSQMENDIKKWLKDLAKKISEEESQPENVEGLVENYAF